MIRKFLITIFIILTLSITVNAEENSIYSEQYDLSGAEEITEALDEKTKEYLNEFEIDPKDYNWVNNLSYQNVFEIIINILKTGAKTPITVGATILAIILISSALSGLNQKSSISNTSLYASTLATAAVISVPIFSTLSATVNAMKGSASFMTAFVPVFAVIVATSGMPITSASMSALLLGAAQLVSYISNFFVTPLMSGYLAISICSTVSPIVEQSSIASSIKKIALWVMALISTIFIGILGIQTAVNSSADTLTIKTAKFVLGSTLPVAGTALAEALNTVTASFKLLKSSIAIYGAVACILIFLPLLFELFLWRIVLNLNCSIANIFSVGKISSLLKAIDNVISVLISVTLLTGAIFIISLSIIVSFGKT